MPQSLTTKTRSERFTHASSLYCPSQFRPTPSTTPPVVCGLFPVSHPNSPPHPQAPQPAMSDHRDQQPLEPPTTTPPQTVVAERPKPGLMEPSQTCRPLSLPASFPQPQKQRCGRLGNAEVTTVTISASNIAAEPLIRPSRQWVSTPAPWPSRDGARPRPGPPLATPLAGC